MNHSSGNRTVHTFVFAIILGLLAGAALIGTEWLTTSGSLVFVPYGALLLVTLAYLRRGKVRPFGRRFALAFVGFAVATVVLMAWLVTVANPAALTTPVWNKVWPLGMVLGIGAVVSAMIALVAGDKTVAE